MDFGIKYTNEDWHTKKQPNKKSFKEKKWIKIKTSEKKNKKKHKSLFFLKLF